MRTNRIGMKRITIMLGVACIILSIVMTESITSYITALNAKDSQIADMQALMNQNLAEIETLKQQFSDFQNSDKANLTKRITEKNTQITNLTSQIDALNNQISSLQAQVTQNGASQLSKQEKIRDSVMDYIKFNHPETAQFMEGLEWTGGRTTPPEIVGAETYVYASNGWKFTINYPVIPNSLYNITADYSATSTGIPYRIIWKGSWQNWCIEETSYVFAQ
jgi:polyhydroxyalkanoate synthesis regulator phasin